MRREYEHVADDDTMNALRHLRGAWRGWAATPSEVRVQTRDGVVIVLGIDRAKPRPGFPVRRLSAAFVRDPARPLPGKPGFERGGNEVAVLEGESWLTRLALSAAGDGWDDDETAAPTTMVSHGLPGQAPPTATAVCRTTDAVLVTNPHGLGWLVRLGDDPDALELVTDRGEIASFLERRGLKGY